MPSRLVMHKWKHGKLKSHGHKVSSRKQAIAIMLSEKEKEQSDPNYYTNKEHTKKHSKKVHHHKKLKSPRRPNPPRKIHMA